jgi:hypothetical protein
MKSVSLTAVSAVVRTKKARHTAGAPFELLPGAGDYGVRFALALAFVLPRLMLPFMLVAPLFALAFALVVPPAFEFEFMFEFMFEFVAPVLALLFVVVVFVFAFALVFAFAFMFPLALLVFSAGEHAVHTLATARRVRSAKVLRI